MLLPDKLRLRKLAMKQNVEQVKMKKKTQQHQNIEKERHKHYIYLEIKLMDIKNIFHRV